MNPISPKSPGARGDVRDLAAVPTDLAGLFAALFTATTAAPLVPPTPVVMPQVPEGMLNPEATPCAEGEKPQVASGGWPDRIASGTPAFPAFSVAGRPRHEQPGLTAALVDLPSARRAFLEPPAVPDDAGVPADTPEQGRLALPSDMKPVSLPVAKALEQTLAAVVNALPVRVLDVRPLQSQKPSGVLTDLTHGAEAPSLTELVSRDGVRGAATRRATSSDDHPGATSGAGRGTGKRGASDETSGSTADTGEAEAARGVGYVPLPEPGAPVAPPHASLAGVTPHGTRADAPPPAVTAAAGPPPVPEEKPQSAVPTTATVAFDNGEGLEGRLRVSLRGDTLRATIQVPDAAAAERIEQDLSGLSRALRAHGFEEARLTIDVARPATADARRDESSPRDHKLSREQQPHTNERHTRRERGTPREER